MTQENVQNVEAINGDIPEQTVPVQVVVDLVGKVVVECVELNNLLLQSTNNEEDENGNFTINAAAAQEIQVRLFNMTVGLAQGIGVNLPVEQLDGEQEQQ